MIWPGNICSCLYLQMKWHTCKEGTGDFPENTNQNIGLLILPIFSVNIWNIYFWWSWSPVWVHCEIFQESESETGAEFIGQIIQKGPIKLKLRSANNKWRVIRWPTDHSLRIYPSTNMPNLPKFIFKQPSPMHWRCEPVEIFLSCLLWSLKTTPVTIKSGANSCVPNPT